MGTELQLEHVLMYVLLICLHMYIHGHIQKYTCTYESINNFKLSTFLLQIVYIHCMWGEIKCAFPVIDLNPLCCRDSVAINSTYIHTCIGIELSSYRLSQEKASHQHQSFLL